jgi:hypothetical protein
VSAYPGTFEEYKEELQREIKAEVEDWFGGSGISVDIANHILQFPLRMLFFYSIFEVQ